MSPRRTPNDDFLAAGKNQIAARILDAALHLFAERGYAATSVREIVQRADVTNPMLYYYFKSKKGVFAELIDFYFNSMADFISDTLATGDLLEDKLRAVARAHFDACRETPVVLRFVYSVLFGPSKSRPQLDVLGHYESALSAMTQTFARAIESGEFAARHAENPRLLTLRFMGLINNHLLGILATYDFFLDRHDLDSIVDEYLSTDALNRMLDFFFHGAGELTRKD